MLVTQTSCFPDVLLPTNKIVDFAQAKEPAKLFNSIFGMYGLAIQALEHLKAGKLEEFDSLATDCSCHLRALRIAAIVQELMNPTSSLEVELEKALKDLKIKQATLKTAGSDLVAWCQKGKKMTGSLAPIVSALQALKMKSQSHSYCFSIQDALKELHVKSDIGFDLAYVIHAYILKLVKDFKLVEESDEVSCADSSCKAVISSHALVKKEVTKLKKLSESIKILSQSEVNIGFIEKDVYRLAKKHLTDLSAAYLLQETFKFPSRHIYSSLNLNQKIIGEKIELPDFYSLTGAFKVCLQKQIPVLLKVKKCLHAHRYQEPDNPFDVYVYLTPNMSGTKFEYGSFLDLKKDGPLVVVEGKRSGKAVYKELVTDYVQRLLKEFDFMHVCEMDGAQHKQYTSDEDSLLQKPSEVIPTLKDEKYFLEAKKLDELREKAQEMGCAFSNQKLLILSHIFADTIKNQMEQLQQRLKTANFIHYDPLTETFSEPMEA
jgi:hypothetical protein